jgi:hypothetical protein
MKRSSFKEISWGLLVGLAALLLSIYLAVRDNISDAATLRADVTHNSERIAEIKAQQQTYEEKFFEMHGKVNELHGYFLGSKKRK